MLIRMSSYDVFDRGADPTSCQISIELKTALPALLPTTIIRWWIWSDYRPWYERMEP